ncbi:MAG: DUF4124 domain-containing protein [Myxococcaceae bacterium]
MPRALLVCTLVLLAPSARADEIYRWTDAQGETHYTNDPSSIPKDRRKAAVRTAGDDLGEIITGDKPKPAAPAAESREAGRPEDLDLRPDADIRGLVSSYRADRVQDFVVAVLKARYPVGQKIIEAQGAQCTERFVTPKDRASAATVIALLEVTVHECGHFFDLQDERKYFVAEGVSFACKGASHYGAHQSFARRELLDDPFAAKRPPCRGPLRADCDSYADVYLVAEVSGSEQGYDSVLEETLQYVNSLATAYVLADQMKPGASISARDGLLTFLWYVERYLQRARLKHPEVYAYLAADPCWRDATRAISERAWKLLSLTSGKAQLGMNDAAIEALVRDPALSREVERFVRAGK